MAEHNTAAYEQVPVTLNGAKILIKNDMHKEQKPEYITKLVLVCAEQAENRNCIEKTFPTFVNRLPKFDKK